MLCGVPHDMPRHAPTTVRPHSAGDRRRASKVIVVHDDTPRAGAERQRVGGATTKKWCWQTSADVAPRSVWRLTPTHVTVCMSHCGRCAGTTTDTCAARPLPPTNSNQHPAGDINARAMLRHTAVWLGYSMVPCSSCRMSTRMALSVVRARHTKVLWCTDITWRRWVCANAAQKVVARTGVVCDAVVPP